MLAADARVEVETQWKEGESGTTNWTLDLPPEGSNEGQGSGAMQEDILLLLDLSMSMRAIQPTQPGGDPTYTTVDGQRALDSRFSAEMAAARDRFHEIISKVKDRNDVRVTFITFGDRDETGLRSDQAEAALEGVTYEYEDQKPREALEKLDAFFASDEPFARFNHRQTYLYYSIFEVVKKRLNLTRDMEGFSTDDDIPPAKPRITIFVYSDGKDETVESFDSGPYEQWVRRQNRELKLDWKQWKLYPSDEERRIREKLFGDFQGYDVLFAAKDSQLGNWNDWQLRDLLAPVPAMGLGTIWLQPQDWRQPEQVETLGLYRCGPDDPMDEKKGSARENGLLRLDWQDVMVKPPPDTEPREAPYVYSVRYKSLCSGLQGAYPGVTFYFPAPADEGHEVWPLGEVAISSGERGDTILVVLGNASSGKPPTHELDAIHVDWLHQYSPRERTFQLTLSGEHEGAELTVDWNLVLENDDIDEEGAVGFAQLRVGEDGARSSAHAKLTSDQKVTLLVPPQTGTWATRFIPIAFIPEAGAYGMKICMTPTVRRSGDKELTTGWSCGTDGNCDDARWFEPSAPGEPACVTVPIEVTASMSWVTRLVIFLAICLVVYVSKQWYFRKRFPSDLVVGTNNVNLRSEVERPRGFTQKVDYFWHRFKWGMKRSPGPDYYVAFNRRGAVSKVHYAPQAGGVGLRMLGTSRVLVWGHQLAGQDSLVIRGMGRPIRVKSRVTPPPGRKGEDADYVADTDFDEGVVVEVLNSDREVATTLKFGLVESGDS
ncbi:MAG: hypothetical protein QGG40_01805 [Myxococcota bacterium]|nr:hypothetical protein [Myxococcota bacterium]